MAQDEVEAAGFTDVVFVSREKAEKSWRETTRVTYVGKRNGRFFKIVIVDDDNAYKGPRTEDLSSHEISEADYKRLTQLQGTSLSSIEDRIVDVARDVARRQRTIAYSDLNKQAQLGLDLDKLPDRNTLSGWLGNIVRHEVKSGRPPLPAVVVYKGSTDPGPGFFAIVDELGLRQAGEDNDAVHMRLLTDVYRHYKAKVTP